MDYIDQEKESIIEELLKSGKVKPGQLINYQYFKELYEPYKEKMAEVDFSTVLGIKYNNYDNIKYLGTRTTVLKDKKEEVKDEEKQQIVENLLKSGKVKPGQLINYQYFKELYKPHRETMSEEEFARILGIISYNYRAMKSKLGRTKILKDRIEKVSEGEKQEIVEELLKSGKVKPGQLINYERFKKLYVPYAEKMEEVEFASILGISYSNYENLKNKKNKAKVLKGKRQDDKRQELKEEEKKKIVEELLKNGKVKPGQSINYEYFKKLYYPYKDVIGEINFAELLEISYSSYMSIKSKGIQARALKGRIEKTSKKKTERIVADLLNNGKVKPGQLINYQYFKELYEPYKEKMEEVEFAGILGISYSNYNNLKNRVTKAAQVLKDKKKELSEEEKNEIIEKLLKSGNLKLGQLINYEYFKELYEPYKEKIEEVEFAGILGINSGNYKNIKYLGTKAQIMHYKDKEKIERIKYIVNQDSRYYSQEELVDLSEKYNCSIDAIIQYLVCSGMDSEFLDAYKKVLEERR